MAKASAVCKCATCGKEFVFTAFRRNSSEARSFEEWASENITECSECKTLRLTETAIAEAKEYGWPDLSGSDKQVAWALRIRAEMTDSMVKCYPERREEIMLAIDRFVSDHTSAAWWIDNRDRWTTFERTIRELAANLDQQEEARETESDEDEDTIIEPATRQHDGIVDIRAADDLVSAKYRKDDDFRAIVKSLSYRWNGESSHWYLSIGPTTGTAQERAAELGNKLLNAGFAVRIQDREIRQNAVDGKYEPMTYRWIAKRGQDNFFITWARDDSFYDQAKSLPSAKYSSPGIVVPGREYEAVLDFAHAYDFRLTKGATALVESLQKHTSVSAPASQKDPEYNEIPLENILDSSREIIADLKD